MPRNPVKEKALPVGIFLILSTVLVVGGLLWIRGLLSRPAYTFTIRYQNPDPINEGVAVYYRGVQIGRVVKVDLAPDFQSTLVQVGVEMKDLHIPDNVNPYLRLEGITGQRFVELEPPKGPVSNHYIAGGEVIPGAASLTWERIQEQISHIAEERTLEKILVSTQQTMEKLEDVSVKLSVFVHDARYSLRQVAGQLNQTAGQIGNTAHHFSRLAQSTEGQIPKISAAIQQFSQNTSTMDDAMASLDNAADKVAENVDFVGSELRQSGLINKWAQAGSGVQQATGQFSQASSQFGETMTSLDRQLAGSNLMPQSSTTRGLLQPGIHKSYDPIAMPAELATINSQLARLQQTNRMLENLLLRIPDQRLSGRMRIDLQSIQEFSQLIDQLPQQVQLTDLAGQDLATVQHHFNQLQQFGDLLTTGMQRLKPTFTRPEVPFAQQIELVHLMDQLEQSGHQLSRSVRQAEPLLPHWMKNLPQPKPGLIGLVRNTAEQLNQTAASFDCVAGQLNHMLSQRFLGFKLFFGKPGGGFKCSKKTSQTTQP